MLSLMFITSKYEGGGEIGSSVGASASSSGAVGTVGADGAEGLILK